MTVSLNRIETTPIQDSIRNANDLKDILRPVLATVAVLDPDQFHSHTLAGQAAVTLSDVARAATAALGAAPGTALGTAPGVVVVRDLTLAASRLDVAATGCGATADPLVVEQLTRSLTVAVRKLWLSLPVSV